MTITARVYEIIMKALDENPEGLQWTELLRIIKTTDPTIHPKTANGLIWKLVEKFPDQIHKPQKGLFQLVKYK